MKSLPPRGAWIEIAWSGKASLMLGRSPHGERGLKFAEIREQCKPYRRSPHGERGLKSEAAS